MTAILVAVPTSLVGKIVTLGDHRYDWLRSTYTTLGRPAAVDLAESAADVAKVLRLAREQRLPLSVRSGGDGLSDSATNNDGLVIDLSAVRAASKCSTARAAWYAWRRAPAGPRWPRRLAPMAWPSAPVTTATSVWAGGHGRRDRMARAHYGLTIDHVRAVEVVLPDGTQGRADAANAWTCCG